LVFPAPIFLGFAFFSLLQNELVEAGDELAKFVFLLVVHESNPVGMGGSYYGLG
jgi:hypothetical protein